MASVPVWAIGVHQTSLLLTPQTVNATTGVLADTTPTSQFVGHLQSSRLISEFDEENISSCDRPFKNMVNIEQGTSIEIEEHEKYGGTNLAAYVAYNGTYYKYVWTRGQQSFTGYAKISSYETSMVKRGITGRLRLAPMDTGTAQPVYG